MWARRCGAPAKLPSALKILFMSSMSGGIGLAVYNYMASGDVSYLDITKPTRGSVICLTEWPLRSESGSGFFEEQSWRSWYDRKFDWEDFLLDHSCVVPSEVGVECTDVRIPVKDMMRDLGVPMGSLDAVGVSHDYFDISAHIFWWLSLLLWFSITVHDLALIHGRHRDYVMDFPALNKGFPRLRHAFGLTGFFFMRFLFCRCSPRRPDGSVKVPALHTLGLVLGVLLAVPTALWALFVFIAVIGPMGFVLFLCNPIRLSRFWTFGLCLLLAVYCLFLTVSQIVFLSRPETMPRYAVTWHARSISDGLCSCGCTYPMSEPTCTNLLLIGAAACTKSLLVGFRCLKGMRRSQWANLLTVTFAVPVTVYEVDWRTPDNMPIEHRDTNMPVQAELAFDPFALMDEQPNSAFTTVSLQPEELARLAQAKKWNPFGFGRVHEGPKPVPGLGSKYLVHETERIGCCGFPCLTGGMQGQLMMEELADEEELAPLNVDSVTELAPKPSPAACCSPSGILRPLPLASPATVASHQVPPSPMSVGTRTRAQTDVKFACVTRTRAQTDGAYSNRSMQSPFGPSPMTFGTQYTDSSDVTLTPNSPSRTHFSFADAVRDDGQGAGANPREPHAVVGKDEAPVCMDERSVGVNPTVVPVAQDLAQQGRLIQGENGRDTSGGCAASLMSPDSCGSGVTLAPHDPAVVLAAAPDTAIPGIAGDGGTMDWDVSAPAAALEGEGLGSDGALAGGVQRRGRAATTN